MAMIPQIPPSLNLRFPKLLLDLYVFTFKHAFHGIMLTFRALETDKNPEKLRGLKIK